VAVANKADTKQLIMDAAQLTVQALGYNALSFRDLAAEVGVKSSSVHYHFPTKGDLGGALARRYTDSAAAFMDDLLASGSNLDTCLRLYTGAFRAALENDNRMCLCGIMNAEHEALPAEVRVEVDRFTEVNVAWLATLLARATPSASKQSVQEQALAIFAAIGGAQLVARGRGDIGLFDRSIDVYRRAGLIPTAN
jgi:TetR/AcrR family transcriptional repressor of nem operon